MSKRTRIKKVKEPDLQHYWICESCANERGGTFPKGHVCTVTMGNCPYCGSDNTLIPYVDFTWKHIKTAHLRD